MGKITVTKELQNAKLPVGASDFKEWVREDNLFVDKSLFIKEIIESSEQAILMTAPRRFGKTINLSMLKYFLKPEVSDNGEIKLPKHQNNRLFKNLKIERGDHLDIKEIIYRLNLLRDDESLIEDVDRWKEIAKSIDFSNKENVLKNYETNQHAEDVLQAQVKKYIKDELQPKFSGIENFDSLINECQSAREEREQEEKKSTNNYESIASKRKVENEKYSDLKKVIEDHINNSSELKQDLSDYSMIGRNLGKHPVIFLTLGNVARQEEGLDKGEDDSNKTVTSIEKEIRAEVATAYKEHGYLYRKELIKKIKLLDASYDSAGAEISDLEVKFQSVYQEKDIDIPTDLKKLKAYYNGEEGLDLKDGLRFLSELLYKHFGKKAYILVDEYDRPSNYLLGKLLATDKEADDYNRKKEVHDQISGAISSMLCEVGKTHPEYTEKVVMTGIMDVLKRDAGSGFNNVSVYGILDEKFSEYFGIIEDSNEHDKGELYEYLKQIGFKEEEIIVDTDLRNWLKKNYNGYNIPTLFDEPIKVYTPYSLINCLKSKFVDKALKKEINQQIEYKEAPSDWVNSGEIFNSIGFKAINQNLMKKFSDLLQSKERVIDLQYDRYIDIRQDIDINQESKLASVLINHGYLTLKNVSNKGAFQFPNQEVEQYFAKNYYEYWVADKFDGYSASQFIKGYIKDINNGDKIEKLLNDILRKSKANTKEDAEADFQALLNGAGKIYDIFNQGESYLVRSEYQSFNDNRIDGLIAPRNGEDTVVIHEYKKTDEYKDKPAFLKLRESISQPFAQGYLISIFKEGEIEGLNNAKGYANYLDNNANWNQVMIRGLAFSYQGDKQNYNKSYWKVLVKEVILGTNLAKNIVENTCIINTKPKENEKSQDKAERIKKDGIDRIEKISKMFNKECADIYEIFEEKRGYSSLSNEEEFIDSFVEYGISDGILGQTSYKAKQRLKEFMINRRYSSKSDFEDALKKLKHDNGAKIFEENAEQIASAWNNYRKDAEMKKKLHDKTHFLKSNLDIAGNEELYSESSSNIEDNAKEHSVEEVQKMKDVEDRDRDRLSEHLAKGESIEDFANRGDKHVAIEKIQKQKKKERILKSMNSVFSGEDFKDVLNGVVKANDVEAKCDKLKEAIKSDLSKNPDEYRDLKSIKNALLRLKKEISNWEAFDKIGVKTITKIANLLHEAININGGLLDIETEGSLPLSDSQIRESLASIREEFLGRRSDVNEEFYIPQSRVRDQEEVILSSDNIALELGYWINHYRDKLFLGVAKLINKESGPSHMVLVRGAIISDKETQQDKIEIVITDPLSKDSKVLDLYEESGKKLITQMESLEDSHKIGVDVKNVNFLGIQKEGESNCAKISVAQLRGQLEDYSAISYLLKEKASTFQSSAALIVDKVQNLAKIHETLKDFHEQDKFKSFLSIIQLTNSRGDTRNVLLHGKKSTASDQGIDKISLLDPLGKVGDDFYQERLQLLDVINSKIIQYKGSIEFLNLNFNYALNYTQLVGKLLSLFIRFHEDSELSASLASQLNISTSRKRKFHEIENDNPDDWLLHIKARPREELSAKRGIKMAYANQSTQNEDHSDDMNGEASNGKLYGYKIGEANSLFRHLFKEDHFTQIVKGLEELHDVFAQHKNLYLINPEGIKSKFNKELLNFINENQGVIIAGDVQKDQLSCFDHSAILSIMFSRKLSELKIDSSLYKIGIFYTENKHGRHANIFLSTDLEQKFVEEKLILPAIRYYASSTGIDSNSPHILRSAEDFESLGASGDLRGDTDINTLEGTHSPQQGVQSLDIRMARKMQEDEDLKTVDTLSYLQKSIRFLSDVKKASIFSETTALSASGGLNPHTLMLGNENIKRGIILNPLQVGNPSLRDIHAESTASAHDSVQSAAVANPVNNLSQSQPATSVYNTRTIDYNSNPHVDAIVPFAQQQEFSILGSHSNPGIRAIGYSGTDRGYDHYGEYKAQVSGENFISGLLLNTANYLIKAGVVDRNVDVLSQKFISYNNDFLSLVQQSGDIKIKDGVVVNGDEVLKNYNHHLEKYLYSKKSFSEKVAINVEAGISGIVSCAEKGSSAVVIAHEIGNLISLIQKEFNGEQLSVREQISGAASQVKIYKAASSLYNGGSIYTFGLGVDAIADGVYFGYSAFQNDHSEFIAARRKFLTNLNYSVATSISHGATLSITTALGIPLLGKVAIVAHATSYTTGLLKSYTYSWIGEGGYADYCVTGLDNTVKTIAQPIIFATELISVPMASIQGELGWLDEDTKFQNHIHGLELSKTLLDLFSWVTPKFVYDFEQDSKWYQNKIDKANELESYKRHFAKTNNQKLYDGIYKLALEQKYALINSGTSVEDAKEWMESMLKTNVTVKAPEVGDCSGDTQRYLYQYDICFEMNSYEHGKLYYCYSKSANTVDSILTGSQHDQFEVIDGYIAHTNVHLGM